MYVRANHKPIDFRQVADLIANHRLGILVSHSEQGLLATHLPFIFDIETSAQGTLLAHMARANPHAELLRSGSECLVIFSGPQGYVSPYNYPDRSSPPSWNYSAVHCYGHARVLHEDMTLDAISRLVSVMERSHSAAWNLGDLPIGEPERLAQNVVAFEIPVERVEAKFKMSQGEKPQNIVASIRELEASGRSDLAVLIRRHNAGALAEKE